MDTILEQLVWRRAKSRCEYCQLPNEFSPLTYEIDHIIARKHQGPTTAENLALTCFFCNSYKGPNIAGVDPESGRIVRLFHPRKDRWKRHFAWNGPLLIGQSRIGRATIAVLEINHPEFVAWREVLIREGAFPP
ncbi:HNH endonuclease signature motif containing protein [Singulisphaera sp. Ch08]|uniref:HNH endonuclease signature motif containing protein n=1 Tax=Singulisphaera sp. Ch08 TaxID=3120278 RepID=A0AAU7CN39_9BACT